MERWWERGPKVKWSTNFHLIYLLTGSIIKRDESFQLLAIITVTSSSLEYEKKRFSCVTELARNPESSNIQMQPHKLQSDTLAPPPVRNTNSDMLSAPLSAVIHQRAARHRVRQNGRMEHRVHAEEQPVGNKNRLFHSVFDDSFCSHRVIYYCALRCFNIFALLLQYLTVMANLKFNSLLKPTKKVFNY